jgi:hypothetical protein
VAARSPDGERLFPALPEESTSGSGGPVVVLDEADDARLALVSSDLPR